MNVDFHKWSHDLDNATRALRSAHKYLSTDSRDQEVEEVFRLGIEKVEDVLKLIRSAEKDHSL